MTDEAVSHSGPRAAAARTAGDAAEPGRTGGPIERLSLRSRDVDEVRTFGGTHFYPRRFLHPLAPSGRLDARFDVLKLGAITIGNVRYGADVTLGYENPDAYQVGVPLTGHLRGHQGGREILAGGTQASVFRVGEDVVLDRWSADCCLLGVKIGRPALECHLQTLVDAPVGVPLRLPARLDVATGAGGAWAGLVRMVAGEFGNPGGLLDQPLIAARLYECLTLGLLMAVEHPYREMLARPVQAYRPQPVRQAMEAIRAHPEHAFTVAGLARGAGVGVRTLQEGFRRYVGTTPMAYLRDERLARVHEDLVTADPRRTTVAMVAHRWGFLHLGRFAAAHQARYHRTRSQTLHRS